MPESNRSHAHDTDTLQETLFDVANEGPETTEIPEQPLDRDSIPYHRLPEDDRVSEAYASLGGGESREFVPKPPRRVAPRGIATEGPSGIEVSTKMAFEGYKTPTHAQAVKNSENAEKTRLALRRKNAARRLDKDLASVEGLSPEARTAQLLAIATTRASREDRRLALRLKERSDKAEGPSLTE